MLLAALFNAGFGAFHIFFWRVFGWPASLEPSGQINSGVTQILNLCLTFVFFAAAVWLVMLYSDGADADEQSGLMLTIAAFWLFRAGLQPIYFSLRHPASAALFALFLIGSAIHAVPALLS